MTPPSSPPPSPFLGWLRAEDGVLAVTALGLPAVGSWFGLGGSGTPGEPAGVIPGLVQLLAVIGAFAAVLTRPSMQPPVRIRDAEAPRWILAGPLIGGLAFASDGAITSLGLPSGDWMIAVSFVVLLTGFLAADHLPVVPAPVRRAFVVPFMLVSATYFNAFAGTILRSLDIGELILEAPAAGLGFAIFILALILGGMAAFYAMFVVAPRELADPEDSGYRWVLRFALFVGASLLGFGWLGLVT